jgi:hypothetical protein
MLTSNQDGKAGQLLLYSLRSVMALIVVLQSSHKQSAGRSGMQHTLKERRGVGQGGKKEGHKMGETNGTIEEKERLGGIGEERGEKGKE